MTLEEIVTLIKNGLKPAIEFNVPIDDTYVTKGIRARIEGVADDDEVEDGYVCYQFTVNFSEFEDVNRMFETADWYNAKTGRFDNTCREAGYYSNKETYYISNEANTEFKDFSIIGDKTLQLIKLYQQQYKKQNYVSWLENLALRSL